MKRLLPLLALLACGCGSAVRSNPPVAPPGNTAYVMALMGRFSMAHACPVNQHVVLTAAHVTDPFPQSEVPLQPYRWSDSAGGSGTLVSPREGLIPGADLAQLISMEPLAHWYARAGAEPKPGERLWLVEFDFSSAGSALAEHPLEVEVLRVTAGNVVFKPAGIPGSSGSCVLNAAGELVAIKVWNVSVGFAGSSQVGIAVGVWGSWLEEAH